MALTDRVILSWNCGPKARAGQGGPATTRSSASKLTAGIIVAQDAALVAWETAAEALSNAVISRYAFDHGTNVTGSFPTAPLNKGEKWVVTMQETAGNQRFFTHTIPAALEGGNVETGTLNADLTATSWTDYATAVNALLTTPDGNAMSLVGATILTRRR